MLPPVPRSYTDELNIQVARVKDHALALDSLKITHGEDIERERAGLTKARLEHDDVTRELRQAHDKAIRTEKETHGQAMDSQRANYEGQLRQLKAENIAEQTRLTKVIDALQAALADQAQNHSKAMSDATMKHSTQMAELMDALNNSANKEGINIEALKQQHDEDLWAEMDKHEEVRSGVRIVPCVCARVRYCCAHACTCAQIVCAPVRLHIHQHTT